MMPQSKQTMLLISTPLVLITLIAHPTHTSSSYLYSRFYPYFHPYTYPCFYSYNCSHYFITVLPFQRHNFEQLITIFA